jgi:hypothetical protein
MVPHHRSSFRALRPSRARRYGVRGRRDRYYAMGEGIFSATVDTNVPIIKMQNLNVIMSSNEGARVLTVELTTTARRMRSY